MIIPAYVYVCILCIAYVTCILYSIYVYMCIKYVICIVYTENINKSFTSVFVYPVFVYSCKFSKRYYLE